MRIHGVLMVRDGVATLRVALLHHLALGCCQLHVVDNGSTDGTKEVLRRLEGRIPLTWRSNDGPYEQHLVTTELIHQAARAGADWVLVFDHDELWTAAAPLHDVLAASDGFAAVSAPMVNFAQRRDVRRSRPAALLTMDHRPAGVVPPEQAEAQVEAGELSFLEYDYPPKLLLRASQDVVVHRGAHHSPNLGGPVRLDAGVEVLHAPLLARDALERKADAGDRTLEATYVATENWHMRRWARLRNEGRLDEDWARLSVDDEGCIDLGHERRAFVRDTRLADAAARWVRPSWQQRAARVLGRSY